VLTFNTTEKCDASSGDEK